MSLKMGKELLFFFLSTLFILMYNTTSIKKQNNNRHLLSIPKVQSKGRERRKDKENRTSHSNIGYSPHILYIYNIYFFSFQICTSDLYTHDCLYCIVFLLFCTLPICILFFCCLCPVLLLSFCCTVELCHYNKFLVCVNIPGQ